MASPKAQYAIQGLSGAAEEAILEPTAGYLMRTVQSMNLTDERGKQTFRQYLDDMGQMMHGEQGLALLAFTFGMSGFNYPQIKRRPKSLAFLCNITRNWEARSRVSGSQGGKDRRRFLNKALSHLHDSWMEDPQASMERASAAAGERLSGNALSLCGSWTRGGPPRMPAWCPGRSRRNRRMFRVYAPARGTEAPREDASVSGEGRKRAPLPTR